jgi:acyl-CoA reductase-like NAD-dependent aldehyde dehydrogenase
MRTIPVINPARISETVGEVQMFSDDDVDHAIERAERSFASWSRTSPEDRASRLVAAASALRSRVPELTSLFVRENGKPLREAGRDIQRSIELMEVIAQNLPEWWRPELAEDSQPVWLRRRARGVTAVISPWNSPVLLSFKRFIPAIAAGNTAVIKPATQCPLTVIECVRTITGHFPEGVIHVVTGAGATVGEKLASDPRIRAVAYTGSTETGRRIMKGASDTLKKVFLELGGNDPAVVLHDAVLDAGAVDRMTNAILRAAGQVCVAIKRIYVHNSRYDELVGKLSAAFDAVVVGDGLHPETTMGPLNNKAQFDFVRGLISASRRSNRTVLTLGRKQDPDQWNGGYFMLPSIILDAEPEDDIVCCEQFGPIVPIMRFADEEQAIGHANRTEFGLRASVWSGDRARAESIADRLEAGAVFYNNHGIFRDLSLEFPGVKQSGFSRESRVAALDHYADTYAFAD